jgi:hypothetical protein
MDGQIINDDILPENGSDAVDGLENNFDEIDGVEITDNGKRAWVRRKHQTIKSISVGEDEICIVVDESLQFLNKAGSTTDSDFWQKTLNASYISSQTVLLTSRTKTASASTKGEGQNNDTRGSSSQTVLDVWTLSRPSNRLTQVTTSQMKMPRFSSSHDDVIYLADQKIGVLTSRDEGRTWQRLMLKPDPELGGAYVQWNHWCVAAVGQRLFCVGNHFNDRGVVTLYYRVTSSASSKPEEDTYELERFINAHTLGLATFTPTHLIGDSKGHVIVADKNDAVHVFNSRGDYIKMLLNKEEHGIIQPSCLALSHDEKTLYVAQKKSNHGVIDTFSYDNASLLT